MKKLPHGSKRSEAPPKPGLERARARARALGAREPAKHGPDPLLPNARGGWDPLPGHVTLATIRLFGRLVKQGVSVSAAARALKLSKKYVRPLARAAGVEDHVRSFHWTGRVVAGPLKELLDGGLSFPKACARLGIPVEATRRRAVEFGLREEGEPLAPIEKAFHGKHDLVVRLLETMPVPDAARVLDVKPDWLRAYAHRHGLSRFVKAQQPRFTPKERALMITLREAGKSNHDIFQAVGRGNPTGYTTLLRRWMGPAFKPKKRAAARRPSPAEPAASPLKIPTPAAAERPSPPAPEPETATAKGAPLRPRSGPSGIFLGPPQRRRPPGR